MDPTERSPTVKKVKRRRRQRFSECHLKDTLPTALFFIITVFFLFSLLNIIGSRLMEPAHIDWKNTHSRFVKDDTYEHINAPKWADLSLVDDSDGDDEAWFCRPDCRHPKTYRDFLSQAHEQQPKSRTSNKNAHVMVMPPPPLGERKCSNNNQSLKRRGGAIASLLLSNNSPARTSSSSKGNGSGKKLREEDLENQDPNFVVLISDIGMPYNKTAKAPSEKVMARTREEEEGSESKKPVPRLKSTLSSARNLNLNLFSGSRDILGQISELCNEIKRIAVGSSSRDQILINEESKAFVHHNSSSSRSSSSKGEDEEQEYNDNKSSCRRLALKEVRAWPPTPQKFPSPNVNSSRCLRTTTLSPLNHNTNMPPPPPKSETDESQGRSNSSTMDMFWLFKPCTQMV